MLYIVATPIGNLEDITFRALRVLKEADLVACEDTRQTQKLMQKYGLNCRLISYHQHSSEKKLDFILSQLEEGKNVAVVSDSGTPGVSDPGYTLIKRAVEKNIQITAVPGPSAAISALVLSGMPTDGFVFFGFLPRKHGKIKKLFEKYRFIEKTIIFYESPFRVKKSLDVLKEVFGGDLTAAVVREMTKKFEQVLRGKLKDVIEQLRHMEIKGEVAVVYNSEMGGVKWQESR